MEAIIKQASVSKPVKQEDVEVSAAAAAAVGQLPSDAEHSGSTSEPTEYDLWDRAFEAREIIIERCRELVRAADFLEYTQARELGGRMIDVGCLDVDDALEGVESAIADHDEALRVAAGDDICDECRAEADAAAAAEGDKADGVVGGDGFDIDTTPIIEIRASTAAAHALISLAQVMKKRKPELSTKDCLSAAVQMAEAIMDHVKQQP